MVLDGFVNAGIMTHIIDLKDSDSVKINLQLLD